MKKCKFWDALKDCPIFRTDLQIQITADPPVPKSDRTFATKNICTPMDFHLSINFTPNRKFKGEGRSARLGGVTELAISFQQNIGLNHGILAPFCKSVPNIGGGAKPYSRPSPNNGDGGGGVPVNTPL